MPSAGSNSSRWQNWEQESLTKAKRHSTLCRKVKSGISRRKANNRFNSTEHILAPYTLLQVYFLHEGGTGGKHKPCPQHLNAVLFHTTNKSTQTRVINKHCHQKTYAIYVCVGEGECVCLVCTGWGW